MILAGARVALSATESARMDLRIENGRIAFSSAGAHSGPTLDGSGLLFLPGLINAHDHLEFNLFPRLGNGPYPNATAWAVDIYRPAEDPIRKHLQVPKPVRLFWGGLKNLLSGVTTVAHHNSYDASTFGNGFPVKVVERFGWAHSLQFCPDVADRYRQTPSDFPFLIHAGEGADDEARSEIHRLNKAGVLGASTVVVHGVALDQDDIALVKSRGASLVWCPSSNLFTLGRTLHRSVLDSGIPIALGSDSALTAEGDLIDEIRVARNSVDPCRIYEMVTNQAAQILRLTSGEGKIGEGGTADFVAVADDGRTPAESLLDLRPEFVLVGGQIKLIAAGAAARLDGAASPALQPIEIEGRGRYFADCDISLLAATAQRFLGKDLRLAGKGVIA